ncbi:MAG: hypothetical protein A2020_10555 [Lentisphaerae bacterium GWF2_45_14]|nr:MAG: hypothetical protein A2020_10555 [Lentisphaerae bacterium GWF2_45_14]
MFNKLKVKLDRYGQSQLLQFWNELNESEKNILESQINEIDFDYIQDLIASHVLKMPETSVRGEIKPAPYFPLNPASPEDKELCIKAEAEGIRLLKEGKVAALTVAGGQGTRLGYDGPKGTYRITPVKEKTFFQYFAESIKKIGEKYGHDLKWYIMTSRMNNPQTVGFFRENKFFGLKESSLFFFTQGTMPAINYEGKILLSSKYSIALSPDGHGGTLLALKNSGALAKMKDDSVELISYFQVDNPLVSVANPAFLGLHSLRNAEMSARMLPKTGPFEKLGNFCMVNGRLEIIEYSDMPEELAESRKTDGSLKFLAGSPAIHIISRSFVESLTASGKLSLPWHRADKKVPFISPDGQVVSPEKNNAVKLESFIFDALPMASRTVIYEARREEEFAPTKNPTGIDSVESCRAMLIARDAERLERAGVKVPRKANGSPDCLIEISPSVIIDDADAAEYCLKNPIAPEKGKALYVS